MKAKHILLLALLVCLIPLATATCPTNYTVDCLLLDQSDCESGDFFSDADAGVNETCTWATIVCEQDGVDCDAPATTTTVATTTTTLAPVVPGSCDPSEMRIRWSVIGITESFKQECYYYPNGTMLRCYYTNETICLPRSIDYYKITSPSNWDIIENPVNATTYILGLARPAVGWLFMIFIVFLILFTFAKFFFKRR
jgi:hypothetical protein